MPYNRYNNWRNKRYYRGHRNYKRNRHRYNRNYYTHFDNYNPHNYNSFMNNRFDPMRYGNEHFERNNFYNPRFNEDYHWQNNPTWYRNLIKQPNIFHPTKPPPPIFNRPINNPKTFVPPPPPPPPPPSTINNTKNNSFWNELPNQNQPIKKNISVQTGDVNKTFTWTKNSNNSNLSNVFKPFEETLNDILNLNKQLDKNINDDKENKPEEENKDEWEFEILEEKIENINDLIDLGKLYDTKYKNIKKKYCLDLKILNNMIEPLSDLNSLIGLNKVKKQLFDQIIFYLQSLDNKNFDMLHTVIAGSPGTGKTELAKIIAKIYNKMGILSKGTFKSVKRNDLIGGYLGQTALKTQKVLNEAKGGVLFIDEAYSLGNKEGRDSYSKECIDTITAFLTEEREDFICIIAGYKHDLEKCFFSQNHGLKRRFNWKFEIGGYTPSELRQIFIKKIKDYGWKIKSDEDIPIKLFEHNKELFEFNGGDMETLFQKCKMAHSLRVLKSHPSEKKILNLDDFKSGLDNFTTAKEKKENTLYKLMYC